MSKISWNRPYTWKIKKPVSWTFSRGWPRGQWALRVSFGPGAGYVGGFTFYVARNCYRPRRRHEGRRRLLVGLTRNWNVIPYTEH